MKIKTPEDLTIEQKKILSLEKQIGNRYRILYKLRDDIKSTCHHPKAYRQVYMWEHDDGYGRQTKVEGVSCPFCGKRCYWKGQEEKYYTWVS